LANLIRHISATCLGSVLGTFLAGVMGRGALLAITGGALGTAVAAWLLGRRLQRDRLRAEAEIAGLRKRLQSQRDQLANTVHELRTPLSALRAAVEMLRDGYAATPVEQAEFLDQAACAAQHLAFLTNDVLDLAAVEAGRLSLHVRSHAARDLCTDARQVMAPLAKSREIGLVVEDPPADLRLLGDRSRILQIAFNLLSNAVKYSTARTTIRLRVRAEPTVAVFEVIDEGIGVPEDLRKRLFTRFGSEGAAAEVESTGLGLHLCRLLVERMNGKVGHREGEDGRGSVFWFSLPRDAGTVSLPVGAEATVCPA
jgi:two-component system, sensor histidine kinase RpfC